MTAATPYGGAVRTCPTCGGDGVGPGVAVRKGFFPGGNVPIPCPDCAGGWVPVDITEQVMSMVTFKDVERVAQWAYPQPGDWVLLPDDVTAVVVQINRTSIATQVQGERWQHGWAPAQLRLIVDRPNPARIPGTEPPT